ncbi:glycosyltransferase family 4 protein [Yinghuangia sp. ASG 101]|uniref:glycosyltransferase family 4 protein n=1 Tax=Yinghuangia sp. ASG 101 TaxID=2896848 RepID=UPI001E344A55|nr:glycosyltransferase family 4 protein [Yinghuangia sp. ASG 101]UGQ10956.1 glycosyltransferase family 4 protein [Yinghuangia sp. ASG 101]
MTGPIVAVAVHDGWYGAGTGAGRSNQALLGAIAGAIAPGVRLAVLPVRLSPGSPGHDSRFHTAARAQLAAVPHQVIALDNGTAGRHRFGDLAAFRHLSRSAADAVHALASDTPRGLLIGVDQPFVGLGTLVSLDTSWTLLYLPRSFAAHHADHARARFEATGLDGWRARGAWFGAISSHMRDMLTLSGVPHDRVLDIPGGLTPGDDVPLTHAPAVPPAAEAGFVLAFGRAEPYKGWDDLIDAALLLRSRSFAIPHLLLAAVTDGAPTDYQRHLAARLNRERLDATLWTRYTPGIPGLLHHPGVKAVVVPSRAEPLGRIPLEAFAAHAAPVVATTAGGLAETVIDSITGYTCRPADPADLADTLRRALSAAPTDVAALRANGAALVARRDYTTCITTALAALAPWAIPAATTIP